MSSRLIVKGLPKRYDEKLLRELFGSGGTCTDAKVMRTLEGRSRQFGFVGFRSESEADAARTRLNGTYVDSCQVKVESARPVGGDDIPRAWSKYTPGSSLHARAAVNVAVVKERATKGNRRKEGVEGHENTAKEAVAVARSGESAKGGSGNDTTRTRFKDLQGDAVFEEFREVAAKRSKNPLWADGTAKGTRAESRAAVDDNSKVLAGSSGAAYEDDEDGNDDDLYQELPDRTFADGERNATPESGGIDQFSEDDVDQKQDATANDDSVDDVQYFKSKIRANLSDDDGEDSIKERGEYDSGSDESSDKNSNADGQMENDPEDDDEEEVKEADESRVVDACSPFVKKREELNGVDVLETGRLFVRNLSFQVTEDDLEALFESYGAIADIHIVQDPRTKQSRGVAFILFVIPETAVKAMAAIDGTVFHGRLIHILPGRARPTASSAVALGMGSSNPGSNKFKDERDTARKESAKTGGDSAAFNAMYMSTAAVADVMAERYGVTKADVYGTGQGESGSAAVRLAAGEARLQAETREYLLANGIDMTVAQAASRAPRQKKTSRNAFLVKNLPARTAENELDPVFAKFGTLDRLLVVPSGLLAVVVYESANDAKKAYGSLAYTRMKDTPLYLEWLASEAIVGSAQISRQRGEVEGKIKAATDDDVADAGQPLIEAGPLLSVFVKNLNFDTRDDALRKHFVKVLRRQQSLVSSIRVATVATRANSRNPTGPRLSYGYGFVEFASPRDAEDAVKLAQSTVLDGHTIELRVANRSVEGKAPTRSQQAAQKRSRAASSKGKPSNKLMVRNLAFEATSRDVKQLFATFGQVKSIRLPRKQDGMHRGFGFVEFVSKNEATAALDALSASHLYGRHLVIDYADEMVDGFASIEDMQVRAANHLAKRRRVEGGRGPDGIGGGDMADTPMDDDHARMMDEMYN
jgi:multiple RNA-binding domain-containing protein 1